MSENTTVNAPAIEKEERIYGKITIDFAARVSQKVLMEEFNTFLINVGRVELTNVKNETIELEIHDHEVIQLFDEKEE